METVIGAAARILVIGLLSTSALEKLRSGGGFRSVLRTLGVRRVTPAWLAVCSAELTVSALMIAPVPRPLATLSVLGLGVMFGLAGAHAVRVRANVECACFGQLGNRRRLGWRQIKAVPLWGFLAVGVNLWAPAGTAERITTLYLAILGVLAVYAYLLVQAVRRARSDRMVLLPPPTVDASTSSLLRFSAPPTDIRALGRAAKGAG